MSERTEYPAGVPCWVGGLHRDVPGAVGFYGPLFGWDLVGSGGEPEYFVARLRGRDVAGIAPMPDSVVDRDAAWMTQIRVESAAETAQQAAGAGGTVVAGPMDLPPAGSLAVIADPAGAVFCAWEPETRRGAQLVNEPGAWAMSVLHTDDLDRSEAFYGTVFGWQTEAFGPSEAQVKLWRLPGYVGGEPQQPVPRDVVGVMAPLASTAAPAPFWSVDFWVEDADATADNAVELGGRMIMAPHDTPGFRQGVLADPQGGAFSVSELVPPSA